MTQVRAATEDPAELSDPARLLDLMRADSSAGRIARAKAGLARLEEVLAQAGEPIPAPPDRDWWSELQAEQALAAVSQGELEHGLELAERVLARADPAWKIAIARAKLARARAWVWEGTEQKRKLGDQALEECVRLFAELGNPDWQAFAIFWRAYAVNYESGHIREAAALMREALQVPSIGSERRAQLLQYYAGALINLGDLATAEIALAESDERARRFGNSTQLGHVRWLRAHIAAAKGDLPAVERLLREAEHGSSDWFELSFGAYFLADAATMLDALGLHAQADAYFQRARARLADDDEAVRQVRALMLGRSGDPLAAIDALQALVRGDWLEKRWVWRHTLMLAWATLRAGGAGGVIGAAGAGAGELAARAFAQVQETAGIQSALVYERELALALAPVAEIAGSTLARGLLLDGERQFIVRLLGAPTVTDAAGRSLALPAGLPGELARMLALHPEGLRTEVVLRTLFPEAPLDAARVRLRQVLKRLRTTVGDELVVRDGEQLRLAPAWVDAREFIAAADRVRAASGPRAVQLAHAALALYGGQLLPTDPYADWAQDARTEVEDRYLELLDLVAADAIRRGSHQEALTALEAALASDPEDGTRRIRATEQLRALGRGAAADYLAAKTPPTSV